MENKKGCIWAFVIVLIVVIAANIDDDDSSTASSNSVSNEPAMSVNHPQYNTTRPSSYGNAASAPQRTLNDNLLDSYRDNSLANGAQPYSGYYGSNSSLGNSKIVVNAPQSVDVIVIVKRGNQNGSVVRHAYIKKGCSYAFSLPEGTYQPFFYSGTSWCPIKTMSATIKGGFLQNESFGKDYPQDLPEYASLTYTLTATVNGNFNTKASNPSEMF